MSVVFLTLVSDDEEVDSGEFKSAYQHFMSGDSDFVSGDQYSGQPSRHKQSLLSLSLRVRQGMATIITSAEVCICNCQFN